jgi:hypothetical protein
VNTQPRKRSMERRQLKLAPVSDANGQLLQLCARQERLNTRHFGAAIDVEALQMAARREWCETANTPAASHGELLELSACLDPLQTQQAEIETDVEVTQLGTVQQCQVCGCARLRNTWGACCQQDACCGELWGAVGRVLSVGLQACKACGVARKACSILWPTSSCRRVRFFSCGAALSTERSQALSGRSRQATA